MLHVSEQTRYAQARFDRTNGFNYLITHQQKKKKKKIEQTYILLHELKGSLATRKDNSI